MAQVLFSPATSTLSFFLLWPLTQGFSPGPRWLHLSPSLVCPQLQERQGGRKIGGRRSPCSLLLRFRAVWVVQPLRREVVLGKGRLCKLTRLYPAERCWGPLWPSCDRVLGCHRELPCFAPLPSTGMLLSSPEAGLRGWSKCSYTCWC